MTDWRRQLGPLSLIALGTLLFAQSAAWAAWPEALDRLVLAAPRTGIGLTLITLALTAVALAQSNMGKSWRIGIDETARPGLVTVGLYRLSRNPIFVGMFVFLAGASALTPTAFSGVILVSSHVAIRYQVLREEAYLTNTYGSSYVEYAKRVGRFLPWFGRVRR
jgi:protein-S-isoprenylcysteine O-methyltransferase Ste14